MISRIGGTDKPLRSRFDISSILALAGCWEDEEEAVVESGHALRARPRWLQWTLLAIGYSADARATREVSLSFTVAAALFAAGGVKVGHYCPFDLREGVRIYTVDS